MAEEKSESKCRGAVDTSRRAFIRKASYSTPALIALGLAAHSREVGAQGPPPPPSFGQTPSSVEPQENDLELIERSRGD